MPKNEKMLFGLCLVEKPISSYIVNIPLSIEGYSSIASIFIPLSNEQGWDKLREINELQKNNPRMEITFKQIVAPLFNFIFDGYTNPRNII